MKKIKNGFTLIELLVVVLIIGILAAVALPKYTKTIKRVHAAEVRALVHQGEKAQQAYFMANGDYTGCLNDLYPDLSSFSIIRETDGCVTKVEKGKDPYKITLTSDKSIYASRIFGWLGNYKFSGWGGYVVKFSLSKGQSLPLSCVEYGYHVAQEGTFCREVMGINTPYFNHFTADRIYSEN